MMKKKIQTSLLFIFSAFYWNVGFVCVFFLVTTTAFAQIAVKSKIYTVTINDTTEYTCCN